MTPAAHASAVIFEAGKAKLGRPFSRYFANSSMAWKVRKEIPNVPGWRIASSRAAPQPAARDQLRRSMIDCFSKILNFCPRT
jgi:hypothetical protein